jgi:hypothetical protein
MMTTRLLFVPIVLASWQVLLNRGRACPVGRDNGINTRRASDSFGCSYSPNASEFPRPESDQRNDKIEMLVSRRKAAFLFPLQLLKRIDTTPPGGSVDGPLVR